MSITIEAIYESGVLKPLNPLTHLKEHEKVLITVEAQSGREQTVLATEESESVVDQLLRQPIGIDPVFAREIIESAVVERESESWQLENELYWWK